MRILLINPNTTEAVTQRMAEAARNVAAPDVVIETATARFGPQIIGSRVESAVAAAAVVERLSQAEGYDAVIVGASVDPGLTAAREMLDVPVIGITEAALHAACLLGGKIGAIVMSANSDTILREMADAYGLGTRLGAVRTLPITPLELLADLDAATRAIAAAADAMVADDGVDTIALIGAVMAGMAPVVQPAVRVPVLEGVSAAVGLAEALVRLRVSPSRAGSYAKPPGERVALLARALGKGPG
ncbi:MAG TPA: aspartate/glutamate racemase family protein [Acetobacteraceae bacterium]|nr:aspartate/glutamate racemase family protein [Acetobacteraceae bacterium]